MRLLIVGNYLENIKCENFKDPETGRVRVRPLPGQDLPTSLFIECSKEARKAYPLGTKFIAKSLKICEKPYGRIYLRAKDQTINKVDD